VFSVTSVSDDATKRAFPLGASFAVARDKLMGLSRTYGEKGENDVDQGVFRTTTPGHNNYLFSHNLKLVPDEHLPEAFSADMAGLIRANLSQSQETIRVYTPSRRGGPARVWEICKARTQTGAPLYNDTGYWILQVPKEIIPDHGEVWTDASMCLLSALFATRQKERPRWIRRRRPPTSRNPSRKQVVERRPWIQRFWQREASPVEDTGHEPPARSTMIRQYVDTLSD